MKRIIKTLKRTMLIIIALVLILLIAGYFYMKLPKFGALPEGKRLELVENSSNFIGGKFKNRVDLPEITEGYSIPGELWKSITQRTPNAAPLDSIPSIKTNLKTLPLDSNALVWFGHSSFFLQIDGIKILVDPVFSGDASPIPGSVKAYKGTDIYTVDDMPEIDYLLLSHDHYDHLDYITTKTLQSKVKHVICGLGAGAHYEKWGYTAQQILEKDWGDSVIVKPGFNIFTESTHHFSGRGFSRGKSLWLSFFIQSPSLNIYYSGDGGYSDRFKGIAEKYPSIDWAIMECGQYNKAWHSVHELPEEVASATVVLKAKNLLPVHHSKFTLSRHSWMEPLEEITKFSQDKSFRLATPLIGEAVNLNDSIQVFTQWWKNVK